MIKYTYIYIISIFALFACNQRPKYTTIDGFAQGTTYHIITDLNDTTGLQYSIDSLLQIIDNSISLYNQKSLLSQINRGETDSIDKHIAYNIELCQKISKISDGAFDITVKPIITAWGFAEKNATEKPNIDSLMQFVGYKNIAIDNNHIKKIDPRIQIDLNTSAQGYTADMLAELIESKGSKNFLAEIGGELKCKGVNSQGKMWSVGVDRPFEGNFTPGASLQAIIELESGEGMATSGNYRKFHTDKSGRKISHIIDARTGYSSENNLLSATVVAPSGVLADVYGTMFMIIGLEESKAFLSQNPEFKALLIYSNEKGEYKSFTTKNLKFRELKDK